MPRRMPFVSSGKNKPMTIKSQPHSYRFRWAGSMSRACCNVSEFQEKPPRNTFDNNWKAFAFAYKKWHFDLHNK